MYGSLMRLDDFDQNVSTADLVNSLVPTNPTLYEKQFTVSRFSAQNGTLRVKKAISYTTLPPPEVALQPQR